MCNSSMYSCIHQSFISCQLVNGPKLQHQILTDVPHVHKQQQKGVALKLHASIDENKFRQRKFDQPAAEDLHEAYLQGETLTKNPQLSLNLHPSYRSIVTIILIFFFISIHACYKHIF